MRLLRFIMAAGVLSLAAMCLGDCTPDRGSDFRRKFPDSIERTWIGPDYFSNRLADWRIVDGRLECVESNPRFPLRTVHLLTRSLKTGNGSFKVSVTTGQIDATHAPSEDAWVGFLIGGGGDRIDYRLTAMTHHKPAADGGLLAVVNGVGIPAFRDNSLDHAVGGTWNISGPVDPADVPILDSDLSIYSEDRALMQGAVILELRGEYEDSTYSLTLSVIDKSTGKLTSRAHLEGIRDEAVNGSIALLSHLGPVESQNGFWFREWHLSGSKISRDDSRVFGPVLGTQYTLSRGVLKLTAQMPPLGTDDTKDVVLQIRKPGSRRWENAAESEWVEDSYTASFRIENWDGSREALYRVRYDLISAGDRTDRYVYEGSIRAEPTGDEFVVAAFTGNKNYTGGLRWNHSGIWFPHLEIVEAVKYHDPDFLFFSGDQVYEGDLTPAITTPFDKAMLDYLYKWYRWYWAFRDLTRDRPSVSIPDDHDVYHGNIWGAGGKKAEAANGLTAQDSGGYRMSPRFVNAVHRTQTSHLPDPFNPTPVEQGISVYYSQIDYGGMSFAVIADRQWKSSPMVMVPEGEFVNGWPRNPDFDPAAEADVPGAVLLGERQLDFLDGFGNRMTVHAVSNPYLTGVEPTVLNNRAPGYGIVRFNRDTRRIVIECWPRWVDPSSRGASQYEGWPVEIDQLDNYGRSASAYLPVVEVEGTMDPVIQVIDERLNEIIYTLRIRGNSFQPKVFRSGIYTLKVGDPDAGTWKVIDGLRASPEKGAAGSVTVIIPE